MSLRASAWQSSVPTDCYRFPRSPFGLSRNDIGGGNAQRFKNAIHHACFCWCRQQKLRFQTSHYMSFRRILRIPPPWGGGPRSGGGGIPFYPFIRTDGINPLPALPALPHSGGEPSLIPGVAGAPPYQERTKKPPGSAVKITK